MPDAGRRTPGPTDDGFEVHLVDGTYELFRHHFAVPSHLDPDGIEVAAVRGVLGSVLGMLEQGATHLGVATDHVVESFRNDLWIDYKTSEGMDPELLTEFPMLEDALVAMGVTVWPMVELEADDALASAARVARDDPRVGRVFICTPDKDLGQCVEDPKVAQLDRRHGGRVLDEAAVREHFGVGPRSIPDYLALVGDTADGFPGLPGWGAKSTATVLAHYEHVDAIPDDAADWAVSVRGAAKLAATLAKTRDAARLFLDLATLRTNADVGTVDEWEWRGATPALEQWAERLGAANLVTRAARLAARRA
jgi:5'-3' exonuclease